jgi:hypothetical protein
VVFDNLIIIGQKYIAVVNLSNKDEDSAHDGDRWWEKKTKRGPDGASKRRVHASRIAKRKDGVEAKYMALPHRQYLMDGI